MIRVDGQEENTGKRTSQKHPNSFPCSGKGRVAVFDGTAILALHSPLRSHTRFCDQPQMGVRASTGRELDRPTSLVSQHDSFRNSDQLNLPLCHRCERTATIRKYNDLQEAGGALNPCESVQAETSTHRTPLPRERRCCTR